MRSIFRDFGYKVELTAYSKDGGIDLFLLSGSSEKQKVVQVKRYKNPIQISGVDAFLGVMVRAGFHEGVFVTTSRLTKGARYAYSDRNLARLGYSVELVDATRLYDAMKTTTKPTTDQEIWKNAWTLRKKMPRWHSHDG